MPSPEPIQLYRADFSSGAVLQNYLLPQFIYQLMIGISMIENKEKEGITITMSMLSALLPPFRKVFLRYAELSKILKGCRKLKSEWLNSNYNLFPILLAEKLLLLNEEWWHEYNSSGAGINISRYKDPNKVLRTAVGAN